MFKIYIDATERNLKKVQLIDDSKVVAEKVGDIDIVSGIQQLLNENKLKLSDIAEVNSNLGPGSFTGLKMSVTISNVLNWILGKKTIQNLDYPNYGREPNISEPKKFKLS